VLVCLLTAAEVKEREHFDTAAKKKKTFGEYVLQAQRGRKRG
jgi:hypothetical protein